MRRLARLQDRLVGQLEGVDVRSLDIQTAGALSKLVSELQTGAARLRDAWPELFSGDDDLSDCRDRWLIQRRNDRLLGVRLAGRYGVPKARELLDIWSQRDEQRY